MSAADLSLPAPAERSADIANRAAAARAIQKARYAELAPEAGIRTNAEADGELLEQVAAPDEAGRKLLTEVTDSMGLSARGYHRVLKVARTLADLDGGGPVRHIHIAEAVSYRRPRFVN